MFHRISAMKKIVAVVALVLILPSLLASFSGTPYCVPPDCPSEGCPPGTYDCTWDWMMQDYANFVVVMALLAMGVTPLVCCPVA